MGEPWWIPSTVVLMIMLSSGRVQEIPALLRAGFWGVVVLLAGAIVLPSLLAARNAGEWTMVGVLALFAGGYLLARFSRTCPKCKMPLGDSKRHGSHHGRGYEVVEGVTCRSCGYVLHAHGANLHDDLDRARKCYEMGDAWREKAPELMKRMEAAGGDVLVEEFVDWCHSGGLREVPHDRSKQTLVVNEFLRQKGSG